MDNADVLKLFKDYHKKYSTIYKMFERAALTDLNDNPPLDLTPASIFLKIVQTPRVKEAGMYLKTEYIPHYVRLFVEKYPQYTARCGMKKLTNLKFKHEKH